MKFNPANREQRRKYVEGTATFGLLLICVALAAPFADFSDIDSLAIFKWIYSAGALVYTVARVADANDPADSTRVRRLRRMEFWGGMAFIAGAAFWFYTEQRLPANAGPLAVLRNTVAFTLAGAFIQIIASWLIVAAVRKEGGGKKQ